MSSPVTTFGVLVPDMMFGALIPDMMFGVLVSDMMSSPIATCGILISATPMYGVCAVAKLVVLASISSRGVSKPVAMERIPGSPVPAIDDHGSGRIGKWNSAEQATVKRAIAERDKATSCEGTF